jgi:hypothetical protein
VLIGLTVVVMEVDGGDAGAEQLEGGFGPVVGIGEVGVAEVEGDADGSEVADAEDLEEMLGCSDFVLEVFEEDFDAEGVGEGFEVLDGGEGVVEGACVPRLVLEAEVEGDGGEGYLLGGLEGALDLVHSIDAPGFFGVDEVEAGWDVAGPEVGGAVGEDGLVEGGVGVGVTEPGGDVADGATVGVVEVVPCGEDLNGLGSAEAQGFEQAVMQALLEKDRGG